MNALSIFLTNPYYFYTINITIVDKAFPYRKSMKLSQLTYTERDFLMKDMEYVYIEFHRVMIS